MTVYRASFVYQVPDGRPAKLGLHTKTRIKNMLPYGPNCFAEKPVPKTMCVNNGLLLGSLAGLVANVLDLLSVSDTL